MLPRQWRIKVYSVGIGETSDDFQAIFERLPNKNFALKADLTQEASISAAVDQIVVEAGAPHGMVVNAGRANHKAALDFTTEEFEALFNVNVGNCDSMTCRCLTVLTEMNQFCGAFYMASCAAEHSSSLVSRGRSCSRPRWPPTARTKTVFLFLIGPL